MRPQGRHALAILAVLHAFVSFGLIGCQAGDVRGEYEVTILLDGAAAAIEGTLVLGASALELEGVPTDLIIRPSASAPDGYSDPDQDDFAGTVNSCLAVVARDPRDTRPRSLRFFDVRVRGSEILVPFSLFEGGDQRIEVIKLRFVANTLGGDVVFHEGDVELEGRIYGDRLGPADAERCLTSLAGYEERLLESIQQAVGSNVTPEAKSTR